MKIRFDGFEFIISNWFLIAIPCVILSGNALPYAIAYISIAFHEAAHALLALHFRSKIRQLAITILGVHISIYEDHMQKKDMLKVLLAGPICNIFIAVLSFATYGLISNITGIKASYLNNILLLIRNIIVLNLCLAGFNLIPVYPFDGGRIMQIILSSKFGLTLSVKTMRYSALVFSLVSLLYGIKQLINRTANIGLLLIGIYFFVIFIKNEREAAYMNTRQLIFRKSRILKKGIYPVRNLVALKSISLGELLKNLDYDNYHFVYVLDNDLNNLRMFTETELLEGMIKYNSSLTLEEFVEASMKSHEDKVVKD
jgi:stage IV sporulation protein FB